MSSADEREIRDAVVLRLRELLPGARIVHELNVAGTGSNRIDVAAVSTQSIVAVEIKSKKDTLKRLGEQWEAFRKCSHHVIVAAHEKHFVEHREPGWRADVPGEMRLNFEPLTKWWRHKHVWQFPRPERGRYPHEKPWTFDLDRDLRDQPRAADMLNMLWAEELRAECCRHGLPSGSRVARGPAIEAMVWNMTGKQIAEAVCRSIRCREFPAADPIRAPD